jgi:hypothetical protein
MLYCFFSCSCFVVLFSSSSSSSSPPPPPPPPPPPSLSLPSSSSSVRVCMLQSEVGRRRRRGGGRGERRRRSTEVQKMLVQFRGRHPSNSFITQTGVGAVHRQPRQSLWLCGGRPDAYRQGDLTASQQPCVCTALLCAALARSFFPVRCPSLRCIGPFLFSPVHCLTLRCISPLLFPRLLPVHLLVLSPTFNIRSLLCIFLPLCTALSSPSMQHTLACLFCPCALPCPLPPCNIPLRVCF